jgi:HPt (histidine-containing phosphotransfer) domain-containing protein
MTNNELTSGIGSVCNFSYLSEIMNAKKHLILGIMDIFLQQIPEELKGINEAIQKTDYETTRRYAHTMKSSVAILGITALNPILREMEELSTQAVGFDKIKELSLKLNQICEQALAEVEKEKILYN